MSCLPFEDQAALALAPSVRERYDFSSEEQYKLFAEQTWKLAKALNDARPVRLSPEVRAKQVAEFEAHVTAEEAKAQAAKKGAAK